jgi:hypothetical protein
VDKKTVRFEALGKNWAMRFNIRALRELPATASPSVADVAKIFELTVRSSEGCAVSSDQALAIMNDLGLAEACHLVADAYERGFPQMRRINRSRAPKRGRR